MVRGIQTVLRASSLVECMNSVLRMHQARHRIHVRVDLVAIGDAESLAQEHEGAFAVGVDELLARRRQVRMSRVQHDLSDEQWDSIENLDEDS